jgi:stearoyl-CoA 9-desaturase NADPH oxidoreductase
MERALKRAVEQWRTTRREVAHGLLFDRQARFWQQRLGIGLARVRDVVDETADTRTFILSPPRGWRGHRAGQYTTIEVEIDGVKVRRCYSISSAPGEASVAITVKRQPGGRVSSWLHEKLRRGDSIGMGRAAGELVLPSTLPKKLLFISGGSGVTPIMSMLRELERRGEIGDVLVVHHARNRGDVIFRDALDGLTMNSRLRLMLSLSDEPDGMFDEQRFAARVPDFRERLTFLCAPAGLMHRVETMWHDAAISDRLVCERFTIAPPRAASTACDTIIPSADGSVGDARVGDGRVTIRLAKSRRSVTVARSAPLLDELERAGLRPPSGCRIGVCHTCRHRKRAGRVAAVADGALSGDGDEHIQLCVSRAATDLELDL